MNERRLARRVRVVWPPLLFGVAILVLWEAAVKLFDWKPYFLPAPSAIVDAMAEYGDFIVRAARVSGGNALVGLAVGTVLGVAVSFLLMRFNVLNDMIGPLAIALNAIPIFVLVSVFYNQFAQTSEVPRRLMVTLVVYFVVLVHVAKGLRQVLPTHLELLHSYAASPLDVLRKARVPNAVPYLFTALRIAAPAAVITAFVAEYFGGPQNGLGSRISSHQHVEERRRLGVRLRRSGARPRLLSSLHSTGEPHQQTAGRQPAGRYHMRHRLKTLGACALALPLLGVAASAQATSVPPPADTTQAECEQVDDVSLMLQWVVQSQFAGYVVARDSGIYERYCLNVDLQEPGTDLPPQQFLADGNVDFAVAWVPKALSTREAGADIVSIAQVFQRSGTLQVSFADSGVTTVEDFEGQNIGAWCCGNDYEVFAALGQVGLDPSADVSFIQQNFDMNALLDGLIVAAEAMIYNEYAQVLEAVNPDTDELYTPDDLNVISYEELGVGMLQDAIWADEVAPRRRAGVRRHRAHPPCRSKGGSGPGTTRRRRPRWSLPPDHNSAAAISCGR